jgi:serralysin
MERSFDESGNAVGAERQLSTSGADNAYSFIQKTDGTIFLAYDNNGDIFGRTFDADWNALSAEVRLNSTTAGSQGQGRLVGLSNGNILLAFQSNDNGDGGGGSGDVIRDRVFSTAGNVWTPVSVNGSSNDFIVNETGIDDQTRPRFARMADNRVLEVWQSDDSGDGSGTTIRGKFMSASGNPTAGGASAEFIIDTTGTGDQTRPLILSFNDGRRLVYWHSFEDGTDTIRGRFIHANGTPDTSDFVIGHLPDTTQPNLTLVLLANQQVAVVYSGVGSGDGSGTGIQGAVGSLNGLTQNPPFVNPGTSPFDLQLPSFTTDQAAAQISRGNAPWNPVLGSEFTMTYAYRDSAPGITYNNGAIGFDRFSAAQIAAGEAAIQLWEDVANIHLIRVQDAGSQYSNNAQFLLWNYASSTANSQAANATGFGRPNFDAGTGEVNPTVFLNEQRDQITAPTFGNNGFALYLHEIGHALGLSHPGNYNVLPNGQTITYDGNAVYREDSHQYTVMSYFDETITHANFVDTFAMTPLLDDIAALQRLYGVNLTTRTGDTVYGFNSNTGSASYTITGPDQHVVFAVWDAGGNDTLDFSGYTMSQSITLEQEQFSSVGGLEFNVVIAKGAVIENAIGGSGSDLILGNSIDNTLIGNGGDDVIAGRAGNDHLSGGDGNDLLDGGAGSDVLDGGAGVDTVTYESATSGVAVHLATHGTAGDAAGDTYIAIENAIGSNFADVLSGNAGANLLAGLDGDDKLMGRGGADTLLGGNGNDRLDGGTGIDVMNGGAGNDIYFVDNAADQVIEAAGGGIDKVFASTSYTLAAGSEIEYLYAHADGKNFKLTGNEFVNRIHGGDGKDTLDGGGGGDFLYGGAGNDVYVVGNAGVHIIEAAGEGIDTVRSSISIKLASNVEHLVLTGTGAINGTGNALDNRITGNDAVNKLDGGLGHDVLSGGGGDDILIGGAGADVLTGGAGDDVFRYLDIADSAVGARDRIVDFTAGDRIDLSHIDAIAGTAHNDRFTFIGTGAFTGHAGELHATTSGANTLVSGDVTGDGKADFEILLTGSHALHGADFLL